MRKKFNDQNQPHTWRQMIEDRSYNSLSNMLLFLLSQDGRYWLSLQLWSCPQHAKPKTLSTSIHQCSKSPRKNTIWTKGDQPLYQASCKWGQGCWMWCRKHRAQTSLHRSQAEQPSSSSTSQLSSTIPELLLSNQAPEKPTSMNKKNRIRQNHILKRGA